MTSKCPICGKTFKTAKGMRVHKANCLKKDPVGIVEGIDKEIEKMSEF
jgi:uncharacterized C2H2 Zn-finger protein